jgi:hypothetical protein
MRLAPALAMVTACVSAVAAGVSAQSAPARVAPPAPPARVAAPSGPDIVDLGVIGSRGPAAQEFTIRPAPRPSRQATVNTLKQKFAPGIDIGETFRVTPNNLKNGPIVVSLRGEGCYLTTSYLDGYINCLSISAIDFNFNQLSPNGRYLVTIEHHFSRVDLHTLSGGKEQVTQVSPLGQPILLVFQTPGNANTATLQLRDIRSGSPTNTTFYALELSRIQ